MAQHDSGSMPKPPPYAEGIGASGWLALAALSVMATLIAQLF